MLPPVQELPYMHRLNGNENILRMSSSFLDRVGRLCFGWTKWGIRIWGRACICSNPVPAEETSSITATSWC